MKKITKSKAKSKAWNAFSKYIRMKDCVDGYVNCVTCGKNLEYNQSQAGHFIGGRTNSILFIEDNVHPQCVGCNVFLRGNYDKYMVYMLDKYGEERVRELAAMKSDLKKYSLQDYLDIEILYKQKLLEL